ncbi:MAG TPA: cysteine--tRNA ligase [Candidatus Absconditabacterales bacterium]|nr:cysteine--tRNA ligase [Candidatus Absconditabacterales bacterium]
MKLKIYNTLSRIKEEFQPLDPELVKIYSCGPTVYGDPHIGNLRAFTFAGLLGDTIRHVLGLKVKHVMNITDVGHLTDDGDHGEDKMEKGSRKEGLTAWEIAEKYEKNFHEYLTKLGIHFDEFPKATDYISQQIQIVEELEKNGYTYLIPGDGIYMDTSKIEDYGKLMGEHYKKNIAGLNAGARVENDGKKNPTDFALWKISPAGEKRQMERDSPRGVGFPGWHIECSAMSRATLGNFFDIHTGGYDHISVHHTNEIAQSECGFTDHKKWVNYRMHCQFLNIKGEKISKSLGNTFSLPEIEARGFSALDLRYFFMQAHYRSFQDFTREGLEAAKSARKNLSKKLKNYYSGFSLGDGNFAGDLAEEIVSPLLNDLDMPTVLAVVHTWSTHLDEMKLKNIYFLEKNILKLGIFDEEIEEKIEIPEEIIGLAQQRVEAKKAKNFGLADELRERIKELGYVVEDLKEGGFEIK